MAGQVLRRRVEDDVRAQCAAAAGGPARRTCCRRRPAAAGRPRPRAGATVADGRRDVDDLEVRVRRRLEPDQPGPLGERLPQRVRPGRQVDVAGVDARRRAGPARDSGTCRRRRRRRRRSRRPAPASSAMAAVAADPDANAIPCVAALERRDRPLEPFAGRVLRAGVLVAARAAARRRPGRRSRSGRSAARRPRSARRARRRRGRPACRTRTPGRRRRSVGHRGHGQRAVSRRAASHRARRRAPRRRCRRSGRRLPEAEARGRSPARPTLSGETDARKRSTPCAVRPVEQRADDLGRDTLAAVRRLDPSRPRPGPRRRAARGTRTTR